MNTVNALSQAPYLHMAMLKIELFSTATAGLESAFSLATADTSTRRGPGSCFGLRSNVPSILRLPSRLDTMHVGGNEGSGTQLKHSCGISRRSIAESTIVTCILFMLLVTPSCIGYTLLSMSSTSWLAFHLRSCSKKREAVMPKAEASKPRAIPFRRPDASLVDVLIATGVHIR